MTAVLKAHDEDDGCDHHWERCQDKGKYQADENSRTDPVSNRYKDLSRECGENQPKPKIKARTLNLVGSVFEAEPTEGLSRGKTTVGPGALTEGDSSCSRFVAPS